MQVDLLAREIREQATETLLLETIEIAVETEPDMVVDPPG